MKVSCFVVLRGECQRILRKLKPLLQLCVVQSMQKSLVCDTFCCVIVIAQAPYSGSVVVRFSALASTIRKRAYDLSLRAFGKPPLDLRQIIVLK